MTRTRYPDGGERLTVTRAGSPGRRRRPFCPVGVDRCAFDPRRLTRDRDIQRRSLSRAKQVVHDLVRCNDLSHLLTLTAGPFEDAGHARRAFSAFLASRRHGRFLRQWFEGSYVAVAGPYAETGGYHIHAACPGPLPADVLSRLKSSWTAYLTDVHAMRPTDGSALWRAHIGAPASHHTPETLGDYLCGHLEASPEGKRRYIRGQGMALPVRESVVLPLSIPEARALVADVARPRKLTDPLTGHTLGYTAERRPLRTPRPRKAVCEHA